MHNLARRLSKSLFAVVVLSGCNSLKPFPKIDICAGINEDGRQYGYCIPYHAGEKPDYEVSPQVIFEKGYIMVSPKHYGEIRKYVEYLRKRAEESCGLKK